VHKAGVVAVWIGLLLILLGLVSGFTLLFLGHDDLAMVCMTAVPYGFLFLFGGLVATQLGRGP
jgi:hypothetical protein